MSVELRPGKGATARTGFTLEHVIVLGGAQQGRGDLVTAPQNGSERNGLGHGGSL